MAAGDVVQFGFGSTVGGFSTQQGSRVSRCIRATQNRVDLLGVDVSWIAGASPGNTDLSVSAIVAVWRSTRPLDVAPAFGFPFFASFGVGALQLPAGLELLYSQNATAIQHAGGPGPFPSRYPTTYTLCNVRFPVATVFEGQGQELWVNVTQPVSDQGDIWGGFGVVFLTAIGIDYGALDPSSSEHTQYLSLPRY